MNKSQAITEFWNSFGIPAFDETTVPEYIDDGHGNQVKLVPPYITFNIVEDSLNSVVNLYANIWYKSTSWREITLKTAEIAKRLVEMQPPTIELDNGRLYLTKGTPFAQRMSEPTDDTIRRMYINVQAEFLTAY